jgi:hypothetical protein
MLSARIVINQTPRLQELWLTFPALTKAGGSEAVFVTGIYAPLQKLFALKGEVLDPIFSINAVPKI